MKNKIITIAKGICTFPIRYFKAMTAPKNIGEGNVSDAMEAVYLLRISVVVAVCYLQFRWSQTPIAWVVTLMNPGKSGWWLWFQSFMWTLIPLMVLIGICTLMIAWGTRPEKDEARTRFLIGLVIFQVSAWIITYLQWDHPGRIFLKVLLGVLLVGTVLKDEYLTNGPAITGYRSGSKKDVTTWEIPTELVKMFASLVGLNPDQVTGPAKVTQTGTKK